MKALKCFIPIVLVLPVVGGVVHGVDRANAAACAEKVCIAVVTDPSANKIVITATQNKAGATTKPKVVKPRVVSPNPVVKVSKKPVVRVSTKPIVRKVVPKKAVTLKPKVTAAVSLSDRITQLLPTPHLYANPASMGLIHVPTYFYCDAPSSFVTTSLVLGINVGINLTPTFVWQFGDGQSMTTTFPGRAYPDTTIGHTYRTAGTYTVTVTVTWSGTWSAEGNTYAIQGGNIVQKMSTAYQVALAPTSYTK